jgi:hypothetical protein
MNHRSSRLIAVCALGLLCLAPVGIMAQSAATPPSLPELQSALRDVWIGHVFWVRNVVLMTRLGNAPGAKVAEGQVVQNAKDIAQAISPFYGQAAADKLFGLLAAHYGAIKDYMNASFAGKKPAKSAASDALDANADEIAAFLSSANPNWPKDALDDALRAHAAHHVMQIDAVTARDYKAEADSWTEMKGHIYVIADVLAQGIEKQFGSGA